MQSAPNAPELLETAPKKRRPRRRLLNFLWWLTVVLASIIVGAVAAGSFLRIALDRAPERLPVYSQIEAFSLTERSGTPTTLADLDGKIWVANFIYTSCPTVCPKLTARMREVQQSVTAREAKLGRDAGVRLVSFTVDPENDTPEHLATYAKEHGADARLWLFLTGSLDEISRAVIEGMKIPFEKQGPGTAMEIMHGEKFVLVDQQGRIRSYFDANPEGMRALDRAIDTLLAESK